MRLQVGPTPWSRRPFRSPGGSGVGGGLLLERLDGQGGVPSKPDGLAGVTFLGAGLASRHEEALPQAGRSPSNAEAATASAGVA